MADVYLIPASPNGVFAIVPDIPGLAVPSGLKAAEPPASAEANSAAPTQVGPKPLVALDPNGQATTLSYNVPEPMGYNGRNFITIEVDPSAFNISAILFT